MAAGSFALKPAKRISGVTFGTQSKYPKVEPVVEWALQQEWSPVPGTAVATESEIRFQMTTPRGVWLRFPHNCFWLKYKAECTNPNFAADGANRNGLQVIVPQAQDRLPESYIDPDVGLFGTTFEKAEFSIDGVIMTSRGANPIGQYHTLYQKAERSFLVRGERMRACDSKVRARYTSDITYRAAEPRMTEAHSEMARPVHFEDYRELRATAITAATSTSTLWPVARRDRNLNKLMGRNDDLTNSLIPPQSVIEARFVRQNPLHAYIQTDATKLTDAAALSATAAAADTASDIKIKLIDFKILYQLVKLKDASIPKELKFYHDVVGFHRKLLPSGVDAATLNFNIEKGTKLVYVIACYAHQINYTPNQNKNKVMRFPALTNVESIKFAIGETPLISAEPIDGLHSGRGNHTPASHQLYSYLYDRKLFDEPFHKFRPISANEMNYMSGIYPLDLTNMDESLLDAELKLTFKFDQNMSPQNAVVVCMTVAEAFWRHEVATKEWTLETAKK